MNSTSGLTALTEFRRDAAIVFAQLCYGISILFSRIAAVLW